MASVNPFVEQRQRAINIEKANVPYEPFYGNDTIRTVVYAFTTIVLIVGLLGCGTGVGVISDLFWLDKDASYSFRKLEGNNTYKALRATLTTAISCCALTCLLLLIIVFLYFFYLEQDFLFSERMAINLSVMSQGPNRIRRVAGLLSSYVYPTQDKENDTNRNSLANDFLENLRRSYFGYTGLGPQNEEEYRNMVRNLNTRNQVGGGFGSDIRNITPQEYDSIVAQVKQENLDDTPQELAQKTKRAIALYGATKTELYRPELINQGIIPSEDDLYLQQQRIVRNNSALNHNETRRAEAETVKQMIQQQQQQEAEQAAANQRVQNVANRNALIDGDLNRPSYQELMNREKEFSINKDYAQRQLQAVNNPTPGFMYTPQQIAVAQAEASNYTRLHEHYNKLLNERNAQLAQVEQTLGNRQVGENWSEKPTDLAPNHVGVVNVGLPFDIRQQQGNPQGNNRGGPQPQPGNVPVNNGGNRNPRANNRVGPRQ